MATKDFALQRDAPHSNRERGGVVDLTRHFRTGDRLPPERELAKEFGVNRLTVRQALADLQLRKLILRRTGRNGGTFIAEPVIEYDLTTFAGFSEQARRLGHIAGARVLRTERVEADEATAEALQLSKVKRSSKSIACASPTTSRCCSSTRVSRLSDSPACSVSRSTDRFTNSSSAATTPGRCARSSESHRSPRMRAPRAYWTSPGHAATARRT